MEVILDFGQFKIFTIGLFVFLGLSFAHFLTKRMFGKEVYLKYRYPQIIIFTLFIALILETLRIYFFQMESIQDIGTLFNNASFTSVLLFTFLVYLILQHFVLDRVDGFTLKKAINIFFFFVITGSWLVCIGLLFDGHGYGVPTNLPWGVSYNSINSIVPYTVPVHPTQAYMAIVFFTCWILASTKQKEATNFFFSIVVPSYILVDFIKGDSSPAYLGLSWTQIISLISILIYFYFVVQGMMKEHSEELGFSAKKVSK